VAVASTNSGPAGSSGGSETAAAANDVVAWLLGKLSSSDFLRAGGSHATPGGVV
jgi:hypothetical protein